MRALFNSSRDSCYAHTSSEHIVKNWDWESRMQRCVEYIPGYLLFFCPLALRKRITVVSVFGLFVVRKSKVKKRQAADENDFYDVTSSSRLGRMTKLEENWVNEERIVMWRDVQREVLKETVAPAPEKEEAWTETSAKTPRAHRVREPCRRRW